MRPDDPLPEADELLAAELAFGLLEAEDAVAAERRLAGDVPFARAHDRWCAEAAALFAIGEEAPSPYLWSRIEARLPANDTTILRRALRRWRIATMGAVAAAVALGALVVSRPEPRSAPAAVSNAPLLAILKGSGSAAVTISFDRASGRLLIAPIDFTAGGRSAELWVIPADGTPRSLGIIAPDGADWRPPPPAGAAFLTAGATLAISLEDRGGSRTGAPAGPVIVTGKLAPAS